MPFYPTPDRDDGYDITDFYGVDPRLGTHGDLVELIRTAQRPRHAGDRRPRRQPHVRQAPVVPRGPAEQDLAVPRLLRLARRAAQGQGRRRRLPRPGDEHLAARREDRPVLPAPLLQAPARPQRRQPARCATRSPRSWASGSSSACPASGSTRCRSSSRPWASTTAVTLCPTRTSTCATCATFLGRRVGDGVLLGEVNLPHKDQLTFFGGDGRRRADHAVRLHRHAEALPLAGPAGRRRRWPRRCSTRPTTVARLPVGDLRPQPRRADARQAHRRGAPGGVRRLRPRAGACRSTDAACAAACRRCSTATRAGSGWSTACCSRCPARRCCSTARRSGWARTSRAEGRLAVRTPMQWTDGKNGGFSDGGPVAAARTRGRGRLRPGVRQRRGAAPRPGLAAGVRHPARAALPRVPRARLGHVRGARPAASPRCSRTAAPGTTRSWSRCTTSAPSR